MAKGEFSVTWKSTINLDRVSDDIALAVQHASRVVAERLLSDSRDYVPVLTGRLKDSGHVERARFKERVDRFVYRVVYDTAYAARQHEEEFNHPSLGFFGAAKYITKPLQANKAFYIELFNLSVARFLERRKRL